MATLSSEAPAQSLNVVLITYEFTYSPFSGNGILSRSLAKSLLREGCNVTVWCCRPSDKYDSATSEEFHNHLQPPELSPQEYKRLSIFATRLSLQGGWRKLDADSGWKEFHWDNDVVELDELERKQSLADALGQCHVVCAIDWTGAFAWRSIPFLWTNGTSKPPVAYLNFRVYSSGISEQKLHAWYDDMEQQALKGATSVISLSVNDKKSLAALIDKSSSSAVTSRPIHILLPPLRGDIQELAMQQQSSLDLTIQHLPPELISAPSFSSRKKQRCLVTCIVRLSPEKNTMRFVSFCEKMFPIMEANGYIPFLAGATADAYYAEMIKERLKRVSPQAIIVSLFLSPKTLGAVLERTVLNFHPCSYDAYGMTIIEAAAFGVPTVMASGKAIGAVEIVGNGACFQVDMPQGDKISEHTVHQLETILRDEQSMRSTGTTAKQRALEWDEVAYGKKLMEYLHQAIHVV